MVGSGGRTVAVSAALTIAVTVSVVASVLYHLRRRRNSKWHRRRRRRRHHPAIVVEEEEEEASVDVSPYCCSSSELAKKPQYQFKRVLADNSYASFNHLQKTQKEISFKLHPYEDDITFLLEHPPVLADLITSHDCPDMDTSYVWVHTQNQLESLVGLLSEETIFAVDTEQHTVRSFLGFTALMQISTHNGDFLLDTIALHDVMSILQPVFANPSICKVFHGGDNDVLWLQRDFHIYVMNLFDTAKACLVLSKPKTSLAYLLETYCGVATNKMLQCADWRIRPLSAEMINYARTDAHYLLYIAQCLASELKTHSLACQVDGRYCVNEAYRLSNMVCMQLYTKEIQPSPGDSAATSIISRYSNSQVGISLKDVQTKELIRQLCTWRDLMGRIHDESLQYILSDKAIIALVVKVPKDPTEVYGVIEHADFNKDYLDLHCLSSPSPVIKGHIRDICCILGETTDNPDDLFRKIFQRYLTQAKICPLSIYNYALLSDLNIKLSNTLFPKQNGGKSEVHVGKKASRELFVQKFSCKSPVYHNCRIYASDGRLLCYCDQRKIDWYLRRNLAKIVEHNPPGIVLLFEPKGRPEDEDNEFYIQSKKNICVGCGEKNHYLRYRIIPSCYRIHFPEHLKSHRSHDIVLLCVDCHEIAHSAAEKYKKQVAIEFKIPLFVRKVVNSEKNKVITVTSSVMERHEEVGVSPLQLRTAAMALIRHGSKMPFKRREELMQEDRKASNTLVEIFKLLNVHVMDSGLHLQLHCTEKVTIKSYFGGRDVSANDIEAALLVGMSPYEKRKLERKRGLNFKSSDIRCSINTHSIEESFECACDNNDNGDDLRSSKCINSAVSYHTRDIGGGDRKSLSAYNNPDFKFSLNESANHVYTIVEEKTFCENLVQQQNVCIVESTNDDFDDIENEGPSEDSVTCLSSKSVSARYAKKLSLLGHGPHGRQVVDYILEDQGEDGILQFCQRWRQVFVEAIHPRFLPAGWGIMHSGRREFGQYSVYNPSTVPKAAD